MNTETIENLLKIAIKKEHSDNKLDLIEKVLRNSQDNSDTIKQLKKIIYKKIT